MRIILDLDAQAGGPVPSATLQVKPDVAETGVTPGASSGNIVAMDAGAARSADSASAVAPIPAPEQPSAVGALNAGAAPEIVAATERPATISEIGPPSPVIAPQPPSEGSAGSAPIVIDEFEVPPAVAKRIR